MLQNIREKTSGWIASIILGLIILTMAFFGIESYLTPKVENFAAEIKAPPTWWQSAPDTWPASLLWTTKDISVEDFRKRFDQARQQQRQTQGEAFNASDFEKVENKRAVLDQLVDDALVSLVSERAGVVLPDVAVKKAIMGIEAFQVAGKFDPNQYRLVLQTQNMTPAQFEQIVRADLGHQIIPVQLNVSAFASDAEVDAFIRMTRQVRNLRILDIPPPTLATAPPTEAEIKAWYDAHLASYRTQEQVAVEYLELDAATLPPAPPADEQTLRARYESEKNRFGTSEQRLASHILVKVDEKAPAAAVAAALAKAQALAARARAPGADFAALARENSDDIGSKAAGGDLGPVDKGVFGDAFDKAFFALQPGQVSDPVRLPDGWHVIWFRELQPGNAKSFEEVRGQLEVEYQDNQREQNFNDLSTKLVDKIYSDPSSLAAAAKELQLPIQRTGLFTRNRGEGIAALEPVRKAAFSDPQKIERQVSDPIDLDQNHVVAIHVTDYQPAATLPLAQVHDKVLADLGADRLAKASKARADALLERARKGESLDALAGEVSRTVADLPGMTRQAPNPQLQPLSDAAFRLPAPASGKNEAGLAKLAPDHYALVVVTSVTAGDTSVITPEVRSRLREELANARGAIDSRSFIDALRKQFTIQVVEDRL
jgi:peptidyl-prolyl cis-trans isomerase D